MRYLKQKIAKASEYQRLHQSSEPIKTLPVLEPIIKIEIPCEVKIELPSYVKIEVFEKVKIETPVEAKIEEDCVKKNKPKRSIGNNVMKNYASAMINFALSRLSEPYLYKSPLVRKMPLQLFRQLLISKKRKINCIKNFRELLVIDESQDSEEVRTWKGLFKEACRAFLKYFWVNWIYNSKLEDKSKYLKYRCRLLRRVEYPELFTYLETFSTMKPRKQRSRNSKIAQRKN